MYFLLLSIYLSESAAAVKKLIGRMYRQTKKHTKNVRSLRYSLLACETCRRDGQYRPKKKTFTFLIYLMYVMVFSLFISFVSFFITHVAF